MGEAFDWVARYDKVLELEDKVFSAAELAKTEAKAEKPAAKKTSGKAPAKKPAAKKAKKEAA